MRPGAGRACTRCTPPLPHQPVESDVAGLQHTRLARSTQWKRRWSCLKDEPTFNAGVGSAINLRGDVETDASVMRGQDGGAGAVGCLTDVKNPIHLARLVMEKTAHVMLVGEGARDFALEQGIVLLSPERW